MGKNPSLHKKEEACPKSFSSFSSQIPYCELYPVENITFEDLKVFIKKLNQLDDQYTYFIPNIHLWRYAFSGGNSYSQFDNTTNADPNFNFCTTQAFIENNFSPRELTEVYFSKKNAFRLRHMNSNVWEWTFYPNTKEGAYVARSSDSNIVDSNNKHPLLRARIARQLGKGQEIVYNQYKIITSDGTNHLDPINESPDTLSIKSLLKGRFYFENAKSVYFKFSEKNGRIYADELYKDGRIYSKAYSNLDCGSKHQIDVSNLYCKNKTGVYISGKMNLNSKSSLAYLSLFLGPSVGQRDFWIRRQ